MAPIRRPNRSQVKKLLRTRSCPSFSRNVALPHEDLEVNNRQEDLQPDDDMSDQDKKIKFRNFALTDKITCRLCHYTGSYKYFKDHIGWGAILKSHDGASVLTGFVNFTSNVSFTILASFFDENASQHDLSKSKTGLIVAIYAGIAMIMSPIFGIYLEKIGQKFLLVSGPITALTCSGLFSLLDRVVDLGMYFALGLILRSVQALGSAGYFTGNGHL